jgi:hypothetical protein
LETSGQRPAENAMKAFVPSLEMLWT